MAEELRDRLVVTAFLLRDERVLVLRRSSRVSTYQGRWAGVSGAVDEGLTPEQQIFREIREETGLVESEVSLLVRGAPLSVEDAALGVRWLVHPFLVAVEEPDRLRLDWEHVEARWVRPAELQSLETVPGLEDTLERVWP